MSQSAYKNFAGVPVQGNAKSCGCGGAQQVPLREGFSHMSPAGRGGGSMAGSSCHFPAPAPKRCYCMAAPFSAVDGYTYQRLVDAYGHSTPCGQF